MAIKYKADFQGRNSYTNTMHEFAVEIDDVSYEGEPIQLVSGSTAMECEYTSDETDNFPTVIPSFLNLSFEANETFQFSQMYTDNERALKVTAYKDGQVWGRYFVIPSRTSEPFRDFPYQVSVRCVDGLGILENYKYTNTTGKASVLLVIARCLNKLGLAMNINTYCTLSYIGMGSGNDPYLNTIINQERFEDMDCGEVLDQLLAEWVSGLVQVGGEWYLFRWPDYVSTLGAMSFKKYDNSLNALGTTIIEPDLILGTETGDIAHVFADQMRSVNMPFKSVSIRYEYGFIGNLIDHDASKLFGIGPGIVGWVKYGAINVTGSGFEPYALILGKNITTVNNDSIGLVPVPVLGGSNIKLEIVFNSGRANGVPFTIAYQENGSSTVQYLAPNNTWTTVYGTRYFYNYDEGGGDTWGRGETIRGNVDFTLPPGDGELSVLIYKAYYFDNNVYAHEDGAVRIYEVNFIPSHSGRNIIAETHTATNNGDYSKTPDPIEVSTGESMYSMYVGTMFKADGTTPTNGFKKPSMVGYVPFLQIAATDLLLQHGAPMTRYEGSISGVFPFLSRIAINDLPGLYMASKLRYNFRNCTVSATLNQMSVATVPHTVEPIEYEYEDAKETGVSDV